MPNDLSSFMDQLRVQYRSEAHIRVELFAAAAADGLSVAELHQVVAWLRDNGVSFDLRRLGRELAFLSADMPEYVLRRHLADYLAVALKDEERCVRIETMWPGAEYTNEPMPVLGDDGRFFIPDGYVE